MQNTFRISLAASLSLALVLFGLSELGFCHAEEDSMIRMNLGGIKPLKESQNEITVQALGLFAVQEHNHQQNSLLEFSRVWTAREQVVAGTMYHLTLEAIESGKKNMYYARVWVKPWMNFKKLEHFELAHNVPSYLRDKLGN